MNFQSFFSCNARGIFITVFILYLCKWNWNVELIKPFDGKMLNLYLFMYADDTVLFSESITKLQKMINTVNKCSKQHGLYIN